MKTFRNIGVVCSVVALLLSTTVAFAKAQPENVGQGYNGSDESNESTYSSEVGTSTTSNSKLEDAQERIQEIREKAQERIAEQREKVMQKIEDIKDKEKQQKAQKITDKFEKLNKVWTDHFIELLDRYDSILDKVQDRADIAASKGKNVTSVNSAIQSAQSAIDTAKLAVEEQATKTYTPNLPSTQTTQNEASTTTSSGQTELIKGLKISFQNLHNELFSDLFALRDGPMTNARKAVQNAIQTLGNIPGVDDDNNDDDDNNGNATSTATSTNQ